MRELFLSGTLMEVTGYAPHHLTCEKAADDRTQARGPGVLQLTSLLAADWLCELGQDPCFLICGARSMWRLVYSNI